MDARQQTQELFRGLRDSIVARLEELDGGRFVRRAWERPGGGGGEMSELRGQLFEKGGCNFSAVWGDRYPSVDRPATVDDEDRALGIAPPASEEVSGKPFFATGVSLVLHPRSPWVPVVHMNVRYLEAGEACWFGGGIDLTPFRPFADDTDHFHAALAAAAGDRYPRFKRWADEYFFIPHRNSARGVGGIFFDYLRDGLGLARSVGAAFLPAYVPIVERRRALPWSEADRQAQLRWRGRYVEFNLVYDRGTLFGLKTGGNVDAIFMSLPPLVAW